jgi:hypothetical protein
MSVIEDHAGVGQGPRPRPKHKRPRSAVTSGRKQFVNGDPNSAWARRFHDLVVGLIQDAGGRDRLSEAQFALIKRSAGLECELEQMEGRMSQGEQVDLDRYGRAASHLRRLLETLGLERKPRNVTPPSIEAYARHVLERSGEGPAEPQGRPYSGLQQP